MIRTADRPDAARPNIEWLDATPAETALRLLDFLFADAPPTIPTTRTIDLAPFQEEAVRRARRCLNERGGVVIADSVGLGKTWIGLALIEDVLAAGGRVVVLFPASLRRHWSDPLRRLSRRHEAARSAAGGAATVLWLSHTRLSRDFAPEPLRPLDLVLVDEAHAFRNPRTRRYRALARLCRATPTVLLTATPVNNSLLDLYFQIRLFSGDAAFRDLGIDDLGAAFRAAAPDNHPAPALRAALGAIVIRRTRALIDGAMLPGGLCFPVRASPIAVRYDLRTAYPDLLPALGEFLESATFAPFRAAGRPSAAGLASAGGADVLMRILLLKRLESSTAALRASLRSLRRYHVAFLDSLRKGRLLLPKDHPRGDAAGAQLSMEALVLAPVPRALDTNAIAADTTADLRRIEGLLTKLESVAEDPKRAALRDLMAGPLEARKVLIFSEFRDTAHHLWSALRRTHATALITGDGAFLGDARASRRAVVDRFAPAANGARRPHPRERVDVLIATDVLSEGLNLQDAAHVVSYDLPWNPVRLIQRIGRIDRLGSPHDRVFSYNLLPDHDLEDLLRLMGRLETKLDAIRAGVGAEEGVLPRTAVVTRLAAGDGTLLDDIERADAAPWERTERLRAAWRAWRSSHPVEPDPRPEESVITTVLEDPEASVGYAIVVVAGPAPDPSAAANASPARLRFIRVDRSGDASRADSSRDELLWRALHAPFTAPPDHHFLERAVARALATPESHASGRGIPPGSVAARAARRILHDLALTPNPTPDYCATTARLIERLARSLTAGQETAVQEALFAPPTRPPGDLHPAVETALGLPAPAPAPQPPPLSPQARKAIAALEIRPR